MKFKLLSILFLITSAICSAQKTDEIKEFFWGANDDYKKANTIPDKYKNESAVIIYKGEHYDYHKFGTKVTYTSSIRKRIKLLDQAAITEFSEFSFQENFSSSKGLYFYNRNTSTVNFGIKIIKANGSEVEIDVNKEAVKEDNTKKIAISNLEVGDIIDYYFHVVEPFISVYEYGFEPVERTLGENYPILNLKIQFETENDFFVNFNTYNGAPKLKKTGTKSSEKKYELVATDIPKNDFPRWFYPLSELPCFKFQVFFARSGKFEQRADAFLPEKESIIKETVSKEDVFEFYDSKFYPSGDLGDVDDFLKGKTFKSDEEKVKEVYYFTRHQFYTRYIEAYVMDETKIIPYPYEYYKNPIFFRTEEQFIRYFMQFLKKNNIGYEIIVATARENGSIDDLLIQSNAKVLLKVNTNKPIYFGYFSPFSNPEQFSPELEGTNAYALKVEKNKRVTDIEDVKLPLSTSDDNYSVDNVVVDLNSDFSQVNIKTEKSLYGHNKEFEYDDLVFFDDYTKEDYKKYGTTPLLDLVKNKKKKDQYTKEYDALIRKLKDKREEALKKQIESEYSTKLDTVKVEVKNFGRFGKNDALAYTQSFILKNELIKKAGSNFIFDIGRLMDSQVEIEAKERIRNNNVYINFPRKFEYNITFAIPNGYTVSGIEKLVKNINNETGSFISTAEIKGNSLVVKATKIYKRNYEPKENWSKMVEFLDAAYQFTQEKILLKKN